MLRFVDLTSSYWADSDEPDPEAPPQCGIIDTSTDTFLPCDDGCHILCDLGEVREAGGERAVALVPEGFFERRSAPGGPPSGYSFALADRLRSRADAVLLGCSALGAEDVALLREGAVALDRELAGWVRLRAERLRAERGAGTAPHAVLAIAAVLESAVLEFEAGAAP